MSDLEAMLEHTQWLRPLARGLVDDDHLAEDVLQETWIRAWRQPPRDEQARPAWLARVVRNFVHSQFRGDGRRRRRERVAARPELESESLPLEALELRREIVRALLSLEEPFRSTLILRFYEDLSSAEIARLEGIPAATVRVRLKRGLDRMREQLDDKRENYTSLLFLLAGVPPSASAGSSTAVATSSPTTNDTLSLNVPRSRHRLGRVILVAAVVLLAIGVGPRLFESANSELGDASRREPSPASNGAPGSDRAIVGLSPTDPPPAAGTARPRASSDTVTSRVVRALVPSDEVRLRVIDLDGRPVPGARVATGESRLERTQIAAGYASAYEFLLAEPCPKLLGYTSGDGTLSVPRKLLLASPLAVAAEGFSTHRERAVHREITDAAYRVTLEPAMTTTITVEAESGARVRRGSITVQSRDGSSRYRLDASSGAVHVSHDDIELVSVRAPGFAAVQELLTSPVHRLRLLPGRSASGRVVDAQGAPVAGATILMRSTQWRGTAHTVVTDDAGRFETFGLADAGSLDLEVRHPDHPRATSRHPLPSTDVGEIRLAEAHFLAGRVVDPEGEPCVGALVHVLPEGAFFSRDVERVSTGENGRFRTAAMTKGAYTLRVEHPDFAPRERRVNSDAEEPTVVRLDDGASITGRIETPSGRPLAGVPLRIGMIVGDELRGPVVYSAIDGSFRVDHLPAGPVTHRPRRPVLRWRALGKPSDTAPVTADLIVEVFRPHQLLRANGVDIPRPAHFGSRNTAAIQVGRELHLVVAEPELRPAVEFELLDTAGTRLRAFTNVLIVSPNDWTMKDFAGIDGQPFHLPDPWVLDGAQFTVMSRGYGWHTQRLDLRGGHGRVRLPLHPTFERPPVLETELAPATALLAAPLLPGCEPLAALPIGATDDDGRLVLTDLGPGRYALCVPGDPAAMFGSSGKRRLALPMDEVRTIGHFTLSTAEGQRVSAASMIARPEEAR